MVRLILICFLSLNVLVFFLIEISKEFEAYTLSEDLLSIKEHADDLVFYLPEKFKSEGTKLNKDILLEKLGGEKFGYSDFIKMYNGHWFLRVPSVSTQASSEYAIHFFENIAKVNSNLKICLLVDKSHESPNVKINSNNVFFVNGRLNDSGFETGSEPYVFRITRDGGLIGINELSSLEEKYFQVIK